MSISEQAIVDVLTRAQQIIAEKFPDHGYVILLVDGSDGDGDKLQYATNFNALGLRAIGEVLCDEGKEDDEFPDPPEGVGVQ